MTKSYTQWGAGHLLAKYVWRARFFFAVARSVAHMVLWAGTFRLSDMYVVWIPGSTFSTGHCPCCAFRVECRTVNTASVARMESFPATVRVEWVSGCGLPGQVPVLWAGQTNLHDAIEDTQMCFDLDQILTRYQTPSRFPVFLWVLIVGFSPLQGCFWKKMTRCHMLHWDTPQQRPFCSFHQTEFLNETDCSWLLLFMPLRANPPVAEDTTPASKNTLTQKSRAAFPPILQRVRLYILQCVFNVVVFNSFFHFFGSKCHVFLTCSIVAPL